MESLDSEVNGIAIQTVKVYDKESNEIGSEILIKIEKNESKEENAI